MENRIVVNIGTDHAFECATDIIGRSGEGDSTKLEITIPDKLHNCSVYLDFEMPNGEKLRTPKLEIEGGVAVYKVAQYLLTEKGELKVQLVFVNEGGAIWKSFKKRFNILKSINAEEEIPDKEDFITKAQRILDELSGEVAEIVEKLASDADFVDSVILAMETPTKVLTTTGSELRFFVGTQAEYDALTDTSNLFAIITDDTTKDGLLADIRTLKTANTANAKAITANTTAIQENANAITALQDSVDAMEESLINGNENYYSTIGTSGRRLSLKRGKTYIISARLGTSANVRDTFIVHLPNDGGKADSTAGHCYSSPSREGCFVACVSQSDGWDLYFMDATILATTASDVTIREI